MAGNIAGTGSSGGGKLLVILSFCHRIESRDVIGGSVGDGLEGYRESIAAVCPELGLETVELFRAGQNNQLILVNSGLIFRFPKYGKGVAGLRREHAILSAARPRLPLATPEYIYHNLDDGVGRALVGYRKLPGSPLWPEDFRRIADEGTIDRLAADIASFLQALHAVPLETVDIPPEPSDSPAVWREMFARFEQVVFPRLTAAARAWTTEQFDAFLGDDEQFAFDNVLRHGDMGSSNTLYSAQERRVVGMIDFGHAGIGDPAVDFAGLYVCFGEAFIRRCARVYPLMDLCWDRIRFYADCAFLLEDALFCIEHETEEADKVVSEINRRA
ncbi:MAG: phosphotransferase [Caldilineaceae bacterium SB0661_bin_32]|uniref:Phosphotransferase n=1 Tax=Caldilineaceae bacterium SB0661_bin_32 TaxID=2605255 RepID=A0A6B1DAE1_9CHLR|nr:phosphotransferase [Caldilineaceae bacterium SB0661_bin_32]